ncbi:MAG: PIN domain-containing protein [Tepidisphaeraceae bacterium]
MKVYLDVCCLNRPFDDLSQARVAMEAAAITYLLELIDASRLTDYSSEMAWVEVERMPDGDRRRKVSLLLPPNARIMPLSDDLLDLAETIREMGFDLADAVHLAAAQRLGVEAFVTVDDRVLKRAKRSASRLGVRVIDPMALLEELNDAIER